MDRELTNQRNQAQINKDNIRKNDKRVDHDYKFGDKYMSTNNATCKYETPYNRKFVITQCWTNGMVTLQFSAINNWHNILCIKQYTPDKMLKILTHIHVVAGKDYEVRRPYKIKARMGVAIDIMLRSHLGEAVVTKPSHPPPPL